MPCQPGRGALSVMRDTLTTGTDIQGTMAGPVSTMGEILKQYIAPLSIALLLLTGCASDTEPAAEPAVETTAQATPTQTPVVSEPSPLPEETTEEPAPETMGPGAYTFQADTGGAGTLNVPGEAPADLEALREQAGAEPVTYLTGNFDNRAGTESFDVYTITIYDPEGNAYEYLPASDWVFDIIPEEAPAEIYNQYIDASNSLTSVIDPLQRADYVMVGPAIPEEITGISVSSGFTEIPATPAT